MNAHELYELIVGEGGCDAYYFFNEMSISEACRYINGMNRRHRQSWEQTRLLCSLFCSIVGGDLNLSFPWDNEETEDITEEQLSELRKKARAMEKFMNNE